MRLWVRVVEGREPGQPGYFSSTTEGAGIERRPLSLRGFGVSAGDQQAWSSLGSQW